MKFRKKPVIIEAVQWNGDNYDDIKALGSKQSIEIGIHGLVIGTLEGKMTAKKGDWVIKGVAGEVYSCKPDIFEKTYEAV